MDEAVRSYHTTNLFTGRASDAGGFSKKTPAHENFLYHQITLVASGALAAGSYKVRFSTHEGDQELEYSVNTGKTLSFSGGRSAMAFFEGLIKGIHLEVGTPFTSGKTVSCVLSSSHSQFTSTSDVTD